MTKTYDISEVKFDKNILILVVDGNTIKLNLSELSVKLANATDSERNDFSISPSGYGLHWQAIDEDLSIYGILKQTLNNRNDSMTINDN